ncbi:MAG: efflux RND transporter periplasmic adaptor subunit [Bacteroidia bacterium]|nr:efflux RND transporter periplasmic adaptor subunit [Bacteroidia bacterium]
MNKGCLIALVAILVILTIGLGIYFTRNMSGEEDAYELTQPYITDIMQKTVATGSIKPRKEVMIKPQVSGIVERLFLEAGDLVQQGDRIAKIKLVPSPVNINNAQSSVELAKMRYEDATRELSRQRKVSSKKLDIENARMDMENAIREERRYKQLLSDGVVADAEYQRFKLDAELRKTTYENQLIVSDNTLQQLANEVNIRKQELNAARNNLQLLRDGASANFAAVSNQVLSTVDGMILDIPVEEGSSVIERNNFNEGTSIATIADMNSLIFEGTVDESDVGKLKVGMPLKLSVGALEDITFDAALEYISPKGIVEEGTVKFEIKAAIENVKDVFLRAGYSASGDIILGKRDSVLALKERDVIFRNDSTFVKVYKGNDQFDETAVEVGLSNGIEIELLTQFDTSTQVRVMAN